MISTKPSDGIDSFLDFMNQTMGEDKARERVGAPSHLIQQFADLVRWPLPELYLSYLREFGQEDRNLKMADDNDSRLTKLLEFYAEQQGEAESEIPSNSVVIGAYGLSGERALLYPASNESENSISGVDVEPSVVVSEYGDVEYTYAQTFRNHLYRQAFVRGKLGDGALFSLRRNEEEMLPRAKKELEGLGFQAYWFSDNYQVCLERMDGEVVYIERIPGRTSMYGCFRNRKTRDDLKRNLIQQLDLQDSTPDSG